MYDAKNEPNEFVGEDRGDAVSKACRFFGREEDELNIQIPEAGAIYGLGALTVVVAVPKDANPPKPGGDSGDRGDRGGRGRGDRDRGRGRDRGDRGGRGRDRDRGRESSRAVEEEPEAMPSAVAEIAEVAEVAAPPVGESRGTVEGRLGEVGEWIRGTVERMKLGGFRISESAEGDFVVYELRGEAAISLGTGDGRAVDALQLLGNQAAMRISDEAPRVVVDAEGNSERRADFLTRLAERAAKRAGETKRSVALDPMNARDRRALHMSIRELGSCATMSVGTGRYRQVVVVPEGSPDYEEALASSRQNASAD